MKAVKPQIAVLMVLMVLMALVTLISGCSQPGLEAVPPTSPQARPADFPAAFYEQAAASGQQVLKVDTSRSLVSITVRRAGALASLGHDHVIASRQLQGYVAPGWAGPTCMWRWTVSRSTNPLCVPLRAWTPAQRRRYRGDPRQYAEQGAADPAHPFASRSGAHHPRMRTARSCWSWNSPSTESRAA